MKHLFSIFLLTFLWTSLHAAASESRDKYNFNSGWLLSVGDKSGAEKINYADADWKEVTLPYAFNENEAFRLSIEQLTDTIVWYRKHFRLPANNHQKKVFIEFEGVRQGADFYINGKQHYTFDIEKDSGQYYMRNFTYYNRPYSTDRLEASFEEKQLSFDWPEYSVTAPYWVGVYDENIKLEIMNGRLYFSRELISPVS